MRPKFLSCCLAALGASACIAYGEGSGEVRGSLRVPRCTINGVGNYREASFPEYDLQPSFYFAELRGKVLQVRVQSDTRRISITDTLVLQLRDVTTTPVGVPVEVRPDLEPDGAQAAPVQLSLAMFGSCPRFQTSLLGRGTVTVNQLDARDDGVLDATFTVDLVDGQSLRQSATETVYGQLRGHVRMKLHLIPQAG